MKNGMAMSFLARVLTVGMLVVTQCSAGEPSVCDLKGPDVCTTSQDATAFQPVTCVLPVGQDVPRFCSLALRAMLGLVTGVFELYSIPYWVEYGTLLATVRNGELMPWARDIDLSVLLDDYERVLDALAVVQGAGVLVQRRRMDCPENGIGVCEWVTVENGVSGLQLDIAVRQLRTLDGDSAPLLVPVGRPTPKLQRLVGLRPDIVFPLQTARLAGMPVSVPANPLAVVQQYYGPDCVANVNRTFDFAVET